MTATLGRRALFGAVPALGLSRVTSPRVVSLDFGLTETALALGTVPVGLPDPTDYRLWVIDPVLPDGVLDVGQRTQPNLELLAELAPDLILTIQDHDPILPQLRQIAPVLRQPIYGPQRRPWDRSTEAARTIAARLDRPSAADRLIDGVEQRYAEARSRLGTRRTRPLLLASFLDPRHLRLYGAGSILQDALDRLGLHNAWAGETGIWGSTTVPLEALAPLEDAILLTFDPQPPDLAAVLDRSPLWRALPFVRAGRVAALPPVLMFGTLPAADRFAKVLLPVLDAMADRG
jgi:ABC-type Fe3+-hydroxamate transport system substrate-binding protein